MTKLQIGISTLVLLMWACSSSVPSTELTRLRIESVPELEHAEICVAQSVWVREGAGIQYDEIGVLLDGVPVEIVFGRYEYDALGNKWLLVRYGDNEGWVNNLYVCEIK